MDYGTDFFLENDDIVFTPDGDVVLVSGPAMVAQDIDQTLKITLGALYWDKEIGSSMLLMLNDAESSAEAIIAELERVAIADVRVNPVPVIAEHAGSTYNISPETPLRITRSISGLDTISVGENWIETAGQEDEADDPYRQRIKDRWRSQSLGDTKEVYRYYATSVPGVAAAEIVRTPRGPGSTDVIIAAVNGVPSQTLLDGVTQALHDHELLGFDVQVKSPNIVPITLRIEYAGDVAVGDIRLIAETYVYGLGIGGRFAVRDLYAQYDHLSLTTCEILSPVRDVQADNASIITATITVTKVGA